MLTSCTQKKDQTIAEEQTGGCNEGNTGGDGKKG